MPGTERDLRLLEALERNPETTQADLATQLGVAIGSINWYLKRLIRKGYVKVTHLQRRRLKYLVTPKGLALKGRLTLQYIKASLRIYRELRQAAHEALAQVQKAGYTEVRLVGGDEAADIFRLTCLEAGVAVVKDPTAASPEVRAEGTCFVVEWPEGGTSLPLAKSA